MKNKKVIILEGADCSGKSSLCEHIQKLSEGKCHTLHSNYSKNLPKSNHRRQHKLITKFIKKQFSNKYYTENHTVILDRSYFSDITYGTIGYGSKGTLKSKFKYFDKLLNIITKTEKINVYFIYCRPNKTKFNPNIKDELLDNQENSLMEYIYDTIIFSKTMHNVLNKNKIKFYVYNFNVDSNYEFIDKFLEN